MNAQVKETPRLGRYRILGCLGSGAQGKVYKAQDPRLDRHVAIKVLTTSAGTDGTSQDGACAEARAAARLNHPNVASIFDFGAHKGLPYMVFEHVPGIGLDELFKTRGQLPETEACTLMMGMLAGIDHAHKLGVVHLDLKPANVRVTSDGTAKVLDFGMAQFLSSNGHDLRSAGGSLRYMAPEHFVNGELGTHTDVFALALILMELLTGKRAVKARSWTQMCAMFQGAGLDLSPLVEAVVPDPIINLIRAGIATARDERTPTAGAFMKALSDARSQSSKSGDPQPADDRAVQFVMRRLRSRGDLPAFPKVALDVNRLTADDSNATVEQIANVVMRDNALSTSLLRLTNSAINATRVKAARITDAISRLGFEQVRVVANGMGYFSSMTKGSNSSSVRDAILKSFASGLIARHFAQRLELPMTEEAFLCATLFNTGEHLVMHCLAEEYEEIRARMDGAGDKAKLLASRDVLGVDYAHLGCVVAQSWNLPPEIIAAIGHRSLDGPVSDTPEAITLSRIAASANELCELAAHTTLEHAASGLCEIAAHYQEDLALSEETLMRVMTATAEKMQRFAPALGIAPESSEFLVSLSSWYESN